MDKSKWVQTLMVVAVAAVLVAGGATALHNASELWPVGNAPVLASELWPVGNAPVLASELWPVGNAPMLASELWPVGNAPVIG
ncbi:MAG TPA: hypothetical protein VFV52_09055 [Bacilli bacterium]|nr:hypothetical protein [Bacilli bacterium]